MATPPFTPIVLSHLLFFLITYRFYKTKFFVSFSNLFTLKHTLKKMSAFTKDIIQTFCAATLGSATSTLIQRGTCGAQGAADFVDLALGGFQTGVDFIAYPIALKMLGAASPTFKKNMEDPKGKKYVTWIIGGATTALLGSILKYPLAKAQQARKGEKVHYCVKEIFSNAVDSLGGSIGFPATNDSLAPHLPKQNTAFGKWAQDHIHVHLSNLGATLLSFPISRIRYGAKISDALCGWAHGILGTMYTNDATGFYKALMQ